MNKIIILQITIGLILANLFIANAYPVKSAIDKIKLTDYSAIDHVMKNAPQFNSVAELGAFIKQNAPSELYRIRAAYYWMAINIEYDNSYSRYHSAETFRHRSGVCQGFSELFVEVAQHAGFTARLITGYAKGSGYKPGRPLDSNHAWNLVLFQEEWYPMDVTWSSCLSDYRHYFMTDPEEMIFTHLPVDSKYNGSDFDYSLNRENQLMASIVEYREWDQLPNLYPRNFYAQPDDFRISVYRVNKVSVNEPEPVFVSQREFNNTDSYQPRNQSTKDDAEPQLPDFEQLSEDLGINWQQIQENLSSLWQEINSEQTQQQVQDGLQQAKQKIKEWVADW